MKNYLNSKDIAEDLSVSQRTVNHLRQAEDFPSVIWIGRSWLVASEDYELWKKSLSKRKAEAQ